ncbi:hypothetical protein [Acetobacter okinawensis]|uniref:hypothetical protein n=1 Tax=Acetobacter okinawensis TaxID=1076594 RepID=UPI000472638C|nr:hypothetical protein [Acetobacter okinawensis]
MTVVARTGLAALLLGCATALSLPSAHAMTVKECHEKFKEAKTANTLKGQSFKEFKASSCDTAVQAPAPATAAATAAPAAAKTATKPEAAASAEAEKPAKQTAAATAALATNATLPTAVAAQYAKLAPGKARMKTCLDQYNANKTSNANAGLKWIEKGGGYYSVCNKHLKGE